MSWEILRQGMDLQEHYARSPSPERLPALLQAIRCFESILDTSTAEEQPVLNAMACMLLGTAYRDLPLGDRTENVQRAIACWETSLGTYSEHEFPTEWGIAHRMLGVSYLELRAGNHGENLARAIRHYEVAQRVTSETDSPVDWAEIQNNLGTAYMALPASRPEEKTGNLQRAIACFQAALRVRTIKDWPVEWARLQRNLGGAFTDLPSGGQAENIERAIEFHQAAMQIFTIGAFPTEFALSQFGLAEAYAKLQAGDLVENLKKAISCFEAAQRVHPDWGTPPGWSSVQYRLGNVYREWATGDPAENLQKAIGCYEAALSALDERYSSEGWAVTQNALGTVFCELQTGDRSENIKRAVGHFEAALRVWREDETAEDWAKVQTNLGNAFRALPEGDQAENLQRAIGYYEAALRVYTEEATPAGWARAKSNLGIVYSELPFGNPEQNLELAVTCHQAALRVFTERAYPLEWAHSQMNLGYTRLKMTESAGALGAGIECYESAAQVYNEQNFPAQWARIQNSLGFAYSRLSRKNGGEAITRAIACFDAALRVRTEHAFPIDFATTKQNLGRLYSHLPTGDRVENLDRAIACYRAALRVCTPHAAPDDCRETLNNLNEDLFLRNDWPAVIETTRELITLVNNQCAISTDHSALKRAAEKMWQSLGRGVIAATRLGDFETALRLSAHSKSQNLASEMARGDAHPLHVARRDWSAYRALLGRRRLHAGEYRRLLQLPAEQRSNAEQLTLLEQMRHLDREREEMERRFAHVDPDYVPFAPQVELPRWGEIAAECQAVLVDFRVTLEGTYLFLVGPGEKSIELEQCVSQPELGAHAFMNFLQHWLAHYYRGYIDWRQDLDASIGLLYRLILSALHARIRERYPQVDRVVLMPDFGLNLLPLHSAWYNDDHGKRRYFGDEYEITYAPSIQVLDHCTRRQASQLGRAQSLVALQNPSLAFAEWEIREAERHFSPAHRRRFNAAGIDKQAFIEAMTNAEHLLFTTHGTFAASDAEESGLQIDALRGEYLTAREIVGLDLRRSRLAILSACESGVSEFHDAANEYLGLPAAFLLAGAHSVIGTQWVVDDLATSLLVGRLHENLYERGMGAAAALRAAQRWLRTLNASEARDLLESKEHPRTNLPLFTDSDSETPFADPYYWAAFFAFGAPGAPRS